MMNKFSFFSVLRLSQNVIILLLLSFFLVASPACCAENVVEVDNLLIKDGISYSPDSNEAFTGRAVAYYPSGQKEMDIELHNGRPHGKWTHWYENGQKKEECDFSEGIRVGKLVAWNEKGRMTGEIEYLEGEGSKRVISYYENGQKQMEAEYRQDKPHGRWVFWHENGKKAEQFENRNGQRHGRTTVWYESGQIKEQGEYRDHLRQGKFLRWDEKGALRAEINFVAGDEVSQVEFDEHGNKVASPSVATEPSAIPHGDTYVFSKSGLSIPKQIKTLRLINEQEYEPDGINVSVQYRDPQNRLDISLYVYQSPPDTKGPFLLLDSAGKEILEDREEIIKRHNAVFKLTEPSESYMEEYRRTLNSISVNRGYELKTEYRFLAVPSRKDSPIAYVANLIKTDKIEGQTVRYIWKTYLYAIPGYFVKIHCTYPEPLWLEIGAIDVDFIQSINWDKLLPKRAEK